MIIAINKPYGVLSQFNQNPDYPDQLTLLSLGLPPALMPIGRLDIDSEGLLLLTDEKDLEARLLSPENNHRRGYLVQVDGKPDMPAIEQLRAGGLEIRGHVTRRCRAKLLPQAPELPARIPAVDPTSAARSHWLHLELTEGKNRQVRRMTAIIGFPTLRLIRISIGDFQPTDLTPGQWRVISEKERSLLFR